MAKEPDFGRDLEVLNDNVTAEVGNVLKVLREKKVSNAPIAPKEAQGDKVPPSTQVRDSEEAQAAASQRRQRPSSRSRLKPIVEYDGPRKNVSIRIHPDTDELLTDAALSQRLKRTSPSTRQDIAQEALEDWFRKHGYRRTHEQFEE